MSNLQPYNWYSIPGFCNKSRWNTKRYSPLDSQPPPPPPPPVNMVAVGGIFGGGGYTIATSSNGSVWKGVGKPSIFNFGAGKVKWNDKSSKWIVYGGGGGVDGGADGGVGGGIASSSDGKIWHINYNLNKFIPFFIIKNLEWNDDENNPIWVACNNDSRIQINGELPFYSIAISFNHGNTWKGVNVNDIFTRVNCVTWDKNNRIWIALGKGTYSIATSSDGKTWQGVNDTINKLIFDSASYVACNNDGSKLVAVGEGEYSIATSSDGKTWQGVKDSQNYSIFDSVSYVACNNYGSKWVAVGEGKYSIATSSDNGITWVGVEESNSIFDSITHVACNNDGSKWVAVGIGKYSIASSLENEKTWQGVEESKYTDINNINDLLLLGNSVAWNGNMWVAVGYGVNSSIIISQDGNKWSGLENINPVIGKYALSVAWNDKSSIWIACGLGKYSIAISPDGIIWKGVDVRDKDGLLLMAIILYVIWNEDNSIWIAVGFSEVDGDNGHAVAISFNHGKTWEGVYVNDISFINYVTWDKNNRKWIAVGEGEYSIATSSDGKTWQGVEETKDKLIFDNASYVAYNEKNNIWVAIGQGEYSIATSSDNGTTWQGVKETKDKLIFDNASHVACNNDGSKWVAVGKGKYSIATSSDGIKWDGVEESNLIVGNLSRVACNNDGSIWVAVGLGGIFEGEEEYAEYTIVTSSDGKPWVGVAGPEIFYGASYVTWDNNNSIWVALGIGNYSIATSSNGVKWDGVPESNSIFPFGCSSSWVGNASAMQPFTALNH